MAVPLRLLVLELVTGGGFLDRALPPSLAREGDLMLRRLLQDLTLLDGLQVTVSRDPRVSRLDLPVRAVTPSAPVWGFWRRCMAAVDAVWPIAPETEGALERLSELVLAEGRALIGSRPEAIRVAASKRTTAEHLAGFGLPVPPTVPAGGPPPEGIHGWVVKPDDGAGAMDTMRFEDAAALRSWLDVHGHGRRFVVQPYLPGESLSLSLLCRDGKAWVLACNRQLVAIDDGALRYLGSVVAGAEPLRPDLEKLASAVAAALPGLFGHVGVDLVLGQKPWIVDVNPRLTTSYVGLGAAIGCNPAALALALLDRDLGALERSLAAAPVTVLVDGEP